MQGGQKGLVVNSTNLCAGKNRATANLHGQNGRRSLTRPEVVATGCREQSRRAKRAAKRRASAAAKRATRR